MPDFGVKLKSFSEIIKKISLTTDEWEAIEKDFQNGETKAIICYKYNIKGHQFKALKKYFLGEI